MELLTINLAAGEFKQFRKAGGYIEIIQSIYPVTINMYGQSGGQSNTIIGGLAGLFLDANFGGFDISNVGQVAQTVQILVCDVGENGGSRRQPGIVSITNLIGTNAQQTSGAGVLTLGFHQQAIVAPALNVRGVTIRGAIVSVTAQAGGGEHRIIAAPTTPVSTYPQFAYQIAEAYVAGAANITDTRVDTNYTIPAGWGIYAATSAPTNPLTQANWGLSFEIL